MTISNASDALNKPAAPPSLDGITLEAIVTQLSGSMGWEAMAAVLPIRCFMHDPSLKSSLKFLRRTPWARKKVEQLYLQQIQTPESRQIVDPTNNIK